MSDKVQVHLSGLIHMNGQWEFKLGDNLGHLSPYEDGEKFQIVSIEAHGGETRSHYIIHYRVPHWRTGGKPGAHTYELTVPAAYEWMELQEVPGE